jgi:hypothetical protein
MPTHVCLQAQLCEDLGIDSVENVAKLREAVRLLVLDAPDGWRPPSVRQSSQGTVDKTLQQGEGMTDEIAASIPPANEATVADAGADEKAATLEEATKPKLALAPPVQAAGSSAENTAEIPQPARQSSALLADANVRTLRRDPVPPTEESAQEVAPCLPSLHRHACAFLLCFPAVRNAAWVCRALLHDEIRRGRFSRLGGTRFAEPRCSWRKRRRSLLLSSLRRCSF